MGTIIKLIFHTSTQSLFTVAPKDARCQILDARCHILDAAVYLIPYPISRCHSILNAAVYLIPYPRSQIPEARCWQIAPLFTLRAHAVSGFYSLVTEALGTVELWTYIAMALYVNEEQYLPALKRDGNK